MGIPSKLDNLLELFFNEGTKHWHFKEIVLKAKISEDRANRWLRQLKKEKIIKNVKPAGKMPYFIAEFENPSYKNKKRLYALNQLNQGGLLMDLQSSKNVKAAVIFGSFSRADWYTESDIDIFILGNVKKSEFPSFFNHRDVQLHIFNNKKDIKKIRSGLMHNVINGYFVKGKVQDIVDVKI